MTLTESELKYLVKQTINEVTVNPSIFKKMIPVLTRYVGMYGKNGVSVKKLSKVMSAYILKHGGKHGLGKIACEWLAKNGIKGIIKLGLRLGVIYLVGKHIVLPIFQSAKVAGENMANMSPTDSEGNPNPSYGEIVHHHDYLVDFYKNPDNSIDALRARRKAMYAK